MRIRGRIGREALFRARARPSRNLSATEDCRAGRFYERREAESAGGLFEGSAESGPWHIRELSEPHCQGNAENIPNIPKVNL